ncbi:MAG TPA: hypothetical protein VND93_18315 [Myxococcales bacterium]|nr:hypothetical protein [Myxococcales bacterium]
MRRLSLLAFLFLAAGCDRVDRVNRPLPESFALKALDGRRMERASFVGRPWVMSLWLPG